MTPLPSDSASEPGLAGVDYDAQTDLALPTATGSEPGAVVAPFAGEVSYQPPEPGYDVGRDTAT